MLLCTLNPVLLVAETNESNFSLEGSGRGPLCSADCGGPLRIFSHPGCSCCADSSTHVRLAARLLSARLTWIWKHMQWLLLHGVFESGQHASVVGTNEKQVQNLFSVSVTLCGIFCLLCQPILRTHALPLSSKHLLFPGTEVLFYSSSSHTETIHKTWTQEGKERVVVVGRKWRQHHNVSRCVKHMLRCAGTEMCKCNAQFLSLSDFRKYFM